MVTPVGRISIRSQPSGKSGEPSGPRAQSCYTSWRLGPPLPASFPSGRTWDRTRDLSRVKRARGFGRLRLAAEPMEESGFGSMLATARNQVKFPKRFQGPDPFSH
jgi:hypothetical protein